MTEEELLTKLDEKIKALENHYPEFDRQATLQYMVEHEIKSPSEAFQRMTDRDDVLVEEWVEERPHISRDDLDNEVRKVLFGAGHDDSRPSDPIKLEEKDAPNKGRRSSRDMEEELTKKVNEVFNHGEEQ